MRLSFVIQYDGIAFLVVPTQNHYLESTFYGEMAKFVDASRKMRHPYTQNGHVAKLADALDLGSSGVTLGGSSPSVPTRKSSVLFITEKGFKVWKLQSTLFPTCNTKPNSC